MAITVLSARYGNSDNSLDSAVLIETTQLGWVSTSTPDAAYSGGAWEALQAWIALGNSVSAYVPPEE